MMIFIVALLSSLAAGAVSARIIFARSDFADRLTFAGAVALFAFLVVPLWTGIASGTASPIPRLMVFLAMDVVLVIWFLTMRAKNREVSRSLIGEWITEFRCSTWKARVLWIAIVTWVLVFSAPGWFLPPHSGDAAEYHILQPLQWVRDGTFELGLRQPGDLIQPWYWAESYANLKSLFVLQLAQARGGSFKGAGLIQSLFLFEWLVAFWAASRRLKLPFWAAGAGACFFISMPDTVLQQTELYADIQAASTVFLVAWALMGLFRSGEPRPWIAAVALSLAHMAGAKTSLILACGTLGAFSLVIAAMPIQRHGPWRPRLAWATFAATIIASVLTNGPWGLRMWIDHGNPCYPWQVEMGGVVLFEGPSPHGINKKMLMDAAHVTPGQAGVKGFLESEGVTHLGSRFGGYGPQGMVFAIPAFLALGFSLRREGNPHWMILAGVLLLLCFSVPDLWWPRYGLAVMAPMALAVARLFDRSFVPGRWLMSVLMALCAAWNLYRIIPAITAWPRSPMIAAYPFVTGDCTPLLNNQFPDEFTARNHARTLDVRMGIISHGFSPYFFYTGPGSPSPVLIPQISRIGNAEVWCNIVESSPAGAVIAALDGPEGRALQDHPSRFLLVFADAPWTEEHPWGPRPRPLEGVWMVQHAQPDGVKP